MRDNTPAGNDPRMRAKFYRLRAARIARQKHRRRDYAQHGARPESVPTCVRDRVYNPTSRAARYAKSLSAYNAARLTA